MPLLHVFLIILISLIALKIYNIDSLNDLPVLHAINYVDRLKSFYIELLELRRIHTDLITLHKILNGLLCVNIDNSLTLSMSNIRGNVCKLVKYYSRLDSRKYFFALRVSDI